MRAALVSIGLVIVPFIGGGAQADDLLRPPIAESVPRLFRVIATFDDGTEVAAFGTETIDGLWQDGELRLTSRGHEMSVPLQAEQFHVDPAASTAALDATIADCAIQLDLTAYGVPEPRVIPAVPHAVGVETSRERLVGHVAVCGKSLGPVRGGEIRSMWAPQFGA